ncbi:MAG: DUF4386 domain-containing protein [Candidatus Eremiobacteraeota bacterium]|nr:DUF4386 domain-containing protein [Candidatus Eremiobacteraeota bacterium]
MTYAPTSPQRMARTAGLFYLITVLTGLFAEIAVRGNLIVSGDAAATARNILASEGLWRLGFAADLIGGAAYTVVTLLLYELMKPVSKSLSLLAAFFSLVGIAIGGGAALAHLAPLLLLKAAYMTAFTTAQLQAMALFALRLHANGYLVALVFFALYEIVLGYLIFASSFFPRVLGVLVALGGLAFFVNSFALFLAPAVGNALNSYLLALDGLGEISLTLWLLVMGVNAPKWNARAYPTSVS